MLIDEMLDKIGGRLRELLFGWLDLDWLPELAWWYWWLFLLFIAVGAVTWLFGWSKWVRAIVSFVFLGASVFVAGGHLMYRRLKQRGKLK